MTIQVLGFLQQGGKKDRNENSLQTSLLKVSGKVYHFEKENKSEEKYSEGLQLQPLGGPGSDRYSAPSSTSLDEEATACQQQFTRKPLGMG